MELIYEKVVAIVQSAQTDYLDMIQQDKEGQVPFLYNQRELVRRINHYINDRYLQRDNEAIFWNIATPRVVHFSKLLQFDTKDFMPIGEGQFNYFQAWALRIKAREWFKDEQFYQTLNDIAQSISTYGGSVWKVSKVKGKKIIEESELGNLYFDQAVKDIEDANIVEKHYLSKNELHEKKGVWENIDTLLEKAEETNNEIWEYTGFVEDEDGEQVYKHIIGQGYDHDYIELWSEDIKKKDCPYQNFRLGRYNGRFLGIGVVERLFKLQERTNELVNQNAETTKIASLLLFKSANMDMTGNVLEQALNGQIVGDESFQQVGIQNTGLNQFIQELQLISQQADRLCMTPDIIQGEKTPSGTTFRGMAVTNAAAENAFTIFRQNLGEKISYILMTYIFPDVIKKWNKESIVEIAQDDEDVELYYDILANREVKEKMLRGETIDVNSLEEAKNLIAENTKKIKRNLEVGKNFFDFKFGFRLMPTTETGDKAVMNDAMFNALQMIGANPALLDTPLFRQYLENNGIPYWKLTPKQKEALEQAAQPQGGKLPEQKKPDALLAAAKPQS